MYQKMANATRATVIIHRMTSLLPFFSSAMPRSTPQLNFPFKSPEDFLVVQLGNTKFVILNVDVFQDSRGTLRSTGPTRSQTAAPPKISSHAKVLPIRRPLSYIP
jgi:hypothetical protein